jgi:hypothetical protein
VDKAVAADFVHRADAGHPSAQDPSATVKRHPQEVKPRLLNPLAIGVTLGGRLLEIVVPRPKLRAGYPHEPSLLSPRAVMRTPPQDTGIVDEHAELPVASGHCL